MRTTKLLCRDINRSWTTYSLLDDVKIAFSILSLGLRVKKYVNIDL